MQAAALDSSSAEYATLKEMLYNLVDSVVGHAPVIDRLNGYLLSKNLIPEAVYFAVLTPGITADQKCHKMFSSVMVNIKDNPSNFSLLIKGLKKEGLHDVATKLSDKLQSIKLSKEKGRDNSLYNEDIHSISESSSTEKLDNEESMKSSDDDLEFLPFPIVPIPPDLSYTTIGKMTEGLERLNINVAAAILLHQNLSSASVQSLPTGLQFYEQLLCYIKYHQRDDPLEAKSDDDERKESEENPRDLSSDDISRAFEFGIFFMH
ncbi:PREDICTED: uncharacterized protein LOC109587444 [Amphimedon queenslandica]|uniref:Uncharacterized protein n=1 Tax=Amphimedon queenslandica TaxID=400682 RepID=A0A1X7TJD3_AMPQE|nr:PREDICTED: uncharacterized protein LOC109587444 [Amphimedon queenslandica]|eukprot:XP_019859240.1 PREDICTED: uncharacterized protein LOC109587444 [Amphimedon queenslandica]